MLKVTDEAEGRAEASVGPCLTRVQCSSASEGRSLSQTRAKEVSEKVPDLLFTLQTLPTPQPSASGSKPGADFWGQDWGFSNLSVHQG